MSLLLARVKSKKALSIVMRSTSCENGRLPKMMTQIVALSILIKLIMLEALAVLSIACVA